MFSINDMGFITLEKNGVTLDLLGGDIYSDRIIAIQVPSLVFLLIDLSSMLSMFYISSLTCLSTQEAYQSMASALSEADGFDYTDPEELELLVATLIDLDAMDSKSSVSLLMECSSSPDVSTSVSFTFLVRSERKRQFHRYSSRSYISLHDETV
ncbi:hypothetical protein KSP39_PZI002971 [Platanthera zijinensis]|uniref:Uncharacterized protein n=1 Tax=Platanthera zijinensis TaxID=2320716 RepID=A0AAP0BY16_9ASPA